MLEKRARIGRQNPNTNQNYKDANFSPNAPLKANDSNNHVPAICEINSHREGGLQTNPMRKDFNSKALPNEIQDSYCSTKVI